MTIDYEKRYSAALKWYRRGFYDIALRMFREGHVAGHADSTCMLGIMYEIGQGVKRDKTESSRLFKLASEAGNVRGQANHAYALFRGGDADVGKKMLEEYIDDGIATAMYYLSHIYCDEYKRGTTRATRRPSESFTCCSTVLAFLPAA